MTISDFLREFLLAAAREAWRRPLSGPERWRLACLLRGAGIDPDDCPGAGEVYSALAVAHPESYSAVMLAMHS